MHYFKIPYSVLLLIFAVFIFSCESDQLVENNMPTQYDTVVVKDTVKVVPAKKVIKVEEERSIKIDFTSAESKALFLIDSLPIGSSFSEANNVIQGLSKLDKVQGTAKTTFTLNGDLAWVTLQFEKDSLRSINYIVEKKKSAEAEHYFKAVRNFYSKKIGDYEKEKIEEESRFNPSYYFSYRGRLLTISNNINEGTVSWMFE